MSLTIEEKIDRYGTFRLDAEEYKLLTRFESGHGCAIKKQGTSGGKTTICFTPTGIACFATAKCACGAELSLTDMESI